MPKIYIKCISMLLLFSVGTAVKATPVLLDITGGYRTIDMVMIDGEWTWYKERPDSEVDAVGHSLSGTMIIDSNPNPDFERYYYSEGRVAVHDILAYRINAEHFNYVDPHADGHVWGSPDTSLYNDSIGFMFGIGSGVRADQYLNDWENFRLGFHPEHLENVFETGGVDGLYFDKDGIRTAVIGFDGMALAYNRHLYAVPEPSSIALMGIGLLAGVLRRPKRLTPVD